MSSVCSLQEFKNEFGTLANDAMSIVTKTYPMMKKKEDQLYYVFNLDTIFSEAIDLFSVDPSMVSDCFVINTIFSDETIHTDIIMTLTYMLQKNLDYEPISPEGEFWMTFSDIRTFYGENEFDTRMTELFKTEYDSFKEYFLE